MYSLMAVKDVLCTFISYQTHKVTSPMKSFVSPPVSNEANVIFLLIGYYSILANQMVLC